MTESHAAPGSAPATPPPAVTTTKSGARAPTTSPRCSRRSPWACSRWAELVDRVRQAGRVPDGIPGLRRRQVAAMTERDVDRLVQDASIIRNRSKIQATVDNARAMTSASPTLAELAKSYEFTRKRAPRSFADLPKSTPEAEAFAKQLKAQ